MHSGSTHKIRMALAGVLAGVAGIGIGVARGGPPPPAADQATTRVSSPAEDLRFATLTGPDRTIVRDAGGTVLATMTDGARTVTLNGPPRTFGEPRLTPATVTTPVWVRLLAHEWRPGDQRQPWFRPWLEGALADRSPDVLGAATEYLAGAPADAGFGPPDPAGDRAENSDFYDYLGVPWTFPGGRREEPDPARAGDVDCSGFVRMVYGYRMGYPLLGSNDPGPGLPRRAFAMAERGPGATVVPDRGAQATDLATVQAGDLLFFDLDAPASPGADHSAIYLGRDDAGHHRFVSSRVRADGPTLGDLGGNSVVDGDGHYARSFRQAKRL